MTACYDEEKQVHDTVVLTSPAGDEMHIDSGISNIIGTMWARGIETTCSCEGGEEYECDECDEIHHSPSYIKFTDLQAAVDFVKFLESMDDRIFESLVSQMPCEIDDEHAWLYEGPMEYVVYWGYDWTPVLNKEYR